ncbi:MAG: SGNH/GDSL hydrolase family protein [Pirellulales bacterium]
MRARLKAFAPKGLRSLLPGNLAFCRPGLWLAGVLVAHLVGVPCQAVTISEIVTFDSSLSDTGNASLHNGPLPPPYDGNRATNGLVWVEDLAQLLGVSVPTPSELGGSNYAWGGAGAGSDFPHVGWQINQYLAGHSPRTTDLFVLSGGQNDLYDGADPIVVADQMVDHVAKLASAGAANILVNNLIPMGRTPLMSEFSPEVADLLNYLASTFNAELASQLGVLSQTMNVNIVILDWYSLANSIIDDPTASGLTNATDAAFDGVTVVPNPDEYLFWDGIHPSARGHELLAQAAYDAVQQSIGAHTWVVPEPSSACCAGLGTVGLLVVGYRRRTARRRLF